MNTTSLMPWRCKTDEDNGFVALQQAMNSLFENFSPAFEWPTVAAPGAARAWNPRLDMIETEKELLVTAELPGLEEKDVDVSLSGDLLLIRGDKRAEKEEKGKTFHRLERSWGSFQRALVLPCDVDRNAIKATFAKGLLTVTLPKTESAKLSVRKIPVKAS